MCEDCLLNENTHHHTLIEVQGIREEFFYFEYSYKERKIYVGPCTVAVPDASILQKHSVKFVLSVLELEMSSPDPYKKSLANLYQIGPQYKDSLKHKDVLYHHINLPDYANPSLVESLPHPDKKKSKNFNVNYSLPHLFGETLNFIEFALERGNLLIHCERGQYRSPTIFIAWLISQGMNTSKAIQVIGEEYYYEGWIETYKKNRPLWVEKLRNLEKKHKLIKDYWRKKHAQRYEEWIALWEENQ
eukprot:TRINITY_DN23425_c0_g1_i1.p1 TRINITY_DN23425_c0_g1~~TRINITY_DN23425_c0_g1_i1.p1  ORF type:complete len:286 (+),score=84.72 TRINITY_DN23425_c0_g1_i1:126-860(+)